MNILFVNSDRIGSKIIMYGTSENISHVAVGFENHPFVYHAYETGILKTKVQEFFDHYNLVDHVDIKLCDADEKRILKKFQKSIWYEKYDYSSILYFAWDRLKAKVFGAKQAKVNPLDSKTDMICTEVIYLCDEFYQAVTGKYLLPDDIDLSITKPGQLCKILKSRF